MTKIQFDISIYLPTHSNKHNGKVTVKYSVFFSGGSPCKGEFSRSSVLSVDSSISIPFSLDSLGPGVSIPEPARARTSPPSDTEAIQTDGMLAARPHPDESPFFSTQQSSQQQQVSQLRDESGSFNRVRCMERKTESLEGRRHVDQGAEDSFVSSKRLSEICKLFSSVENVISPQPSASSALKTSHLCSDEDIFTSPQTKPSRLEDSSFSSTSTAGGLRTCTSMLWAGCSSEAMLTPEKLRQTSVGEDATSSSQQTDHPSTQAGSATAATVTGTLLVLSKSARRTEPEGCSAAPPDKAPTQVIKPPSAVSTQQLSSPAVRGAVPENGEKPPHGVLLQSRSSSPTLEDDDQEVVSDGSSESSLAVRVAKLLQKESPATMVSSTPSVTDQEDGKDRGKRVHIVFQIYVQKSLGKLSCFAICPGYITVFFLCVHS